MHIQFHPSISAIPTEQWNRLNTTGYPFLRHEFLHALETSIACTAETGWQPLYLCIYHSEQDREQDQKNDEDILIGVAPCYVKSHSYGEYVFDWSWADAYSHFTRQLTGIEKDYYPKLVCAVPFTPCSGPRFLCHPQNEESLAPIFMQALQQFCIEKELSGTHILFPQPDHLTNTNHLSINEDWTERIGCQFHWFNRNYQTTNDFYAALTSRSRKRIKKERRQLQEQGITFTQLTRADITASALQAFYTFYADTYQKYTRGDGYLSEKFFISLANDLTDNLLLVQAVKNDNIIAASLFFYDSETLYGRYWGCTEDIAGLHFECCYYQGIDFAIKRGLKKIDAGAQGEHKISRGFEPVITRSLHHLSLPHFHAAVTDFCRREAKEVHVYQEQACELLPFKIEG